MEKTMKERILHRITGALTVALAVFVLLVCWVVCTRQQASAADQISAGTYYVSVNVKCDSTSNYGAKFLYRTQTGEEYEQSVNVQNDKSWHWTYYAVSGFPVAIYLETHGNPTHYGHIYMDVRVSPNSDYTSNSITIISDAHAQNGHAGGGTIKYWYSIENDSEISHEGSGDWKGYSSRNWPGIGIKQINVNSTQKRTYKLDANGNPSNYSSWTSSGFTNDVNLNGETFTQYKIECHAIDKFGVRIGGGPSEAEMWGVATYDSFTNRTGFEQDGSFSDDGKWLIFTGTLMPDAHMASQNRNRQTVHLKVGFDYNSDPKSKEYTLTVTDEYYTTKFYDREGNLIKGSSSANGPALVPSVTGSTPRAKFNSITNSSSGIQYTYYGDTVYAPWTYNSESAEGYFVPMTKASGETMLTAAGTPKYGNTDALKAAVRKDAATYHYAWKGWTPLRDDNGNNSEAEGIRYVNSASRYDGAKTGSAAKYETARENLILQECFTKTKHTPDASDHTYCPLYAAATCTTDEKYYKCCSDSRCMYKFTIDGEGALGKNGDSTWDRLGSKTHHVWQNAPSPGPYRAYSIDDNNIVTTTDYTVPQSGITAYPETCTSDGSNGYFYCENCGKCFDYTKLDDDTDANWLKVLNPAGTEYISMDEEQVRESVKISAPGHDYQFVGWTWGTASNGDPDYTTISGEVACTHTAICTDTNPHTFTLSTTAAPTASTGTQVNNSSSRIGLTVKDATCTANGSETYLVPATENFVRITPPEGNSYRVNVAVTQAKAVVTLAKLGHDYRGAYVGTGYDRRTGTYGGHQRQCVRYAQCKSSGINLTYDGDQVTSTNPGGADPHDASTVTTSNATCQNYAVCAACGNPFGALAPHDFTPDANRIQSADTNYQEDFALTDYQGHYYACAFGCGTYGTQDGGERGTHDHTFEAELIRPASCTVNGLRKYTCTACGFEHYTTQDPDLAATGHDYTGQPVTLTDFMTGDTYNTTLTARVTCKNPNCGKYDDEGNQIPNPVADTVTETVDIAVNRVEPTCTENGVVTRTADFTDPAFVGTLLNGEPFDCHPADSSEILRATGHDWINVTVEWSADHSTCIGSAECANNPNHNVTQSARVTSLVVNEPTCTEPGTANFKANFEDESGLMYYDTFSVPKRSFQDIYNQEHMDDIGEIPANGHEWGEREYEWYGDMDNGFEGVDAYVECLNCGDSIEESVVVTSATTPATCEEDGETVWTASFTNPVFTTQTKELTLNRTGHVYNYDGATYKWTRVSGGYRCTATAVCDNDATHVDTEEVTVPGVTTDPTCTTKGKTVYTANFTNENFVQQTRQDEILALGHNWGEPDVQWVLNEEGTDYISATGTIHCANDPEDHHALNETVTLAEGKIEKRIRTAPTCDSTGLAVYKAKFTRQFGTQNNSLVIPKLSHDFGPVHEGKNNTCAAPGFRSYCICNNCQKTFIEDPVGSDNWVEASNLILYPSSEHNDENGVPFPEVTVEAKDATCTEAGTKAVVYCSGCQLIFSIDGHDTYTVTENGVEVEKPLTEKNYRYGTDKSVYVLPIDPTNHSDGTNNTLVEVPGVEATCEQTGVLHHWHCENCDKYFTDAAGTEEIHRTRTILPLVGHDWDYESSDPNHPVTYDWAPDHSTCTATVHCKNNPEHTLSETKAGTKNVVTEVTCETDGRCSFSVSFDNENFAAQTTEEMIDPAIGHDWDYTGAKYKTTYAWDGYDACVATIYCKNDKNHTITRNGEITSETETTQDCDVDGKIVYTATFPDDVKPDTKTQFLPQTGHDWDYTGETHHVTYEWSPDQSHCTAIVRCLRNPAHTTEVTVAAELVKIKVSTCTEAGKGMYEATFGYGIPKAQSEPFELAMTGHKAEHTEATPATCVEEGVYPYYYCSQCGKYFKDARCEIEIAPADIIQPKIDHTLAFHQAIEASCETVGNKQYWTCSYCGKYFSDEDGIVQIAPESVTIPARGHNWIDKEGKEPTCTEAGWKPYKYCLRCKTDDNYVSIPATGHGDYIYDYAHSSTSGDGSLHWDAYTCGHGCGLFYTNLIVTLRDKNGKGIQGAYVTITSNKTGAVFASGSTDNYGEFAPSAKFTEGTYKISVSYEDAKNTYYSTSTMTFYTDENHELHVIEPKIGRTDFAVDTSGGSSDPAPSTPSNVCRWCGEVHTGFFGKIIQFFHNILVMFSR